MALPILIQDSKTGKVVAVSSDCLCTSLLTTTPYREYGHFECVKVAAASGVHTETIVTPDGDGSLRLTDLLLSFEKKNLAEVTVRFSDGSNTELIWFLDMTDAPVSVAIPFAGNWWGWKSAYVEVNVAGAGLDGSVAIGYIKYDAANSLSYSDWNARR
jgi:hypothetical protein